MKRLIIAVIAIVTFGFIKMADDIVSTLGLTQYSARTFILGNFAGDFTNDGETVWKDEQQDDFYYESDRFKIPYIRKVLPDLIAGDKTGAAKKLCEYVKMYVNSEEFMADYIAKREKAKPTREPWKPSPEDIKQKEEQIRYSEKDLADLKKQKVPADMTAQYEKQVAADKVQLKEWKEGNWYIGRWQRAYPEDPTPLVKAKLEAYLALVATVDFEATTTGPRRKFTNPVYEKKGIQWKAIYRAGKEVNAVVTAFVREWLKGEIIAKNKTTMPKDADKTANPAPAKKEMVREAVVGDTSGSPSGTSSAGTEATTEKPKKEKKASMLLKKLKDKVNN
ncbi:MAG: hypothetical protein EOO05_06190 [Chitinophagaceae bacterium]|nr:MAG: hypothetical protein EOO05_06190 [Chitinophagaceae bacterium]